MDPSWYAFIPALYYPSENVLYLLDFHTGPITFNCWVCGRRTHEAFSVEISHTNTTVVLRILVFHIQNFIS
jgi:hypothetical protein